MQSNIITLLMIGIYTLGVIVTLMLYGAIGSQPMIAPMKEIGDWLIALISALLWPALLAMLVIGGIGCIIVGLLGIIVQSIMVFGYVLFRFVRGCGITHSGGCKCQKKERTK